MKTRPRAITSHQAPSIVPAASDPNPTTVPVCTTDVTKDVNGWRNEWARESAIRDGAEALQRAREALERAVEEIKRYEARYDDTRVETFGATSPMQAKADVLNWALGYIASSILGNARLDLIADAQAKLRVEVAKEYATE